MIIANSLNMAFLPGQGDPIAASHSRGLDQSREDTEPPRARGMRSGHSVSAAAQEEQQRERERSWMSWSEPQRLYYRVFRPAVQFIRSQYQRDLEARGRQRLSDYGLVKKNLPMMSRLKYQHWLKLREAR
jgi:hypothetical protein